jgi:hypothetical protein
MADAGRRLAIDVLRFLGSARLAENDGRNRAIDDFPQGKARLDSRDARQAGKLSI